MTWFNLLIFQFNLLISAYFDVVEPYRIARSIFFCISLAISVKSSVHSDSSSTSYLFLVPPQSTVYLMIRTGYSFPPIVSFAITHHRQQRIAFSEMFFFDCSSEYRFIFGHDNYLLVCVDSHGWTAIPFVSLFRFSDFQCQIFYLLVHLKDHFRIGWVLYSSWTVVVDAVSVHLPIVAVIHFLPSIPSLQMIYPFQNSLRWLFGQCVLLPELP